jgi:uncharacterized protein
MKITISHIPPGGFHFEFTENAEFFPVLADMIKHNEIGFASPVSGEISAVVMSDDLVEIKGRVSVTLSCECGRCLEPFQEQLKRTFMLNFVNFVKNLDGKNPLEDNSFSDDEGNEITAKDISTEYFNGDIIELQDAVQEQILLNLPPRPLCSEECKGLCPVCGSNLNLSSCSCELVKGHPAFAVLKGLKT